MVTNKEHYKNILSHFKINGEFVRAEQFGSGHINDTILAEYKINGQSLKYVLRKINKKVFPEPELIVENTILVTGQIKKKLIAEGEKDLNRKVLTLFETSNGKFYHLDETGEYWCLMNFIEDAYTVDEVETEKQAYEAARTYGKFQKYLSDFDAAECNITIKNFHDLEKRLIKFDEVLAKNPAQRAGEIQSVIEKVERFRYINNEFLKLRKENIPVRVTHNDTKINNVMLDSKTSEGLCVIDLDTVMPGIILNDFGDMVRTFTSPSAEDESDLSKVFVRMNIFSAMANGYLSELKNILTRSEVGYLPLGAKIIVYEQAVRFLTDYLEGDVYYKVKYEKHNLIRARNQFALLESIEKNFSGMQKIIENIYAN